MSEQRHIIKRQVIELKIRSSAQARLCQEELSRIYRQRVIPLIEQRCDELAKPDRLYRIQALDLDLGALDPQNLEEEFTAKVDEALCRELARQIDACEEAGPQAQSQLELFAFFARTGSLPWWAEPAHPGLLAENLELLLRELPEALSHLLGELAHEPGPRQRVVNHYTDEQLAALCGLLLPVHAQAFERDVPGLFESLQNPPAATRDLALRFRQSLWDHLLMVAGIGGGQYDSLDDFYRAVLERVAADPDGMGGEGLTALRRTMRAGRPVLDNPLHQAIAVSRSIPVSERLADRLAALQAAGGPLSPAWSGLRAVVPQFPATFQTELLAILDRSPASEPVEAIALHVLRLLGSGSASQAEITRVIHMFRSAAGDSDASARAVFEALPANKEPLDLSFSEAEELSVGNAGLVILWPFLTHFFTRLGLLDRERRFNDRAGRHRAAGLLQVVASEDTSLAEYLLPLNKLLCGLELLEVFDFGPPLLASEAEECTHLLEAVIAQAPILRDMSVDGFRGTFLLRSGLLTTRDGMWILHAERQTYDVVLERFPWSWEWVKLPWMEAPLRVDW
jgi:hypothetical protein